MSEEYSGSAWHRSLQQNPHGAVHCDAPCIGCGTLTTRRAICGIALRNPISSELTVQPERVPWCAGCEARRHRAQMEQVAANQQVLPHLREAARAWLAQQDKEAA